MNKYLQQRTLFPPQIRRRPSTNLNMVVVIPAYDEPYLLRSLMSLHKCELPRCSVEVIVVVNESERTSDTVRKVNKQVADQVWEWAKTVNRPQLWFHVLHHDQLNPKHAGVGLARKIGMDEAVFRLEKSRNKKGVIVCFDADSKCDKNYFIEIEKHFQNNPKMQACGIHFEHPLHGIDFEDEVYEAILDYELHLRYYVDAQRLAGFPFAFQTIGSSMAVRSDAYQQQGGMNKRKAGEDFYFLHKFIELGKFKELNSTRVIPSPRPSHRVPFGTGKAVDELMKSQADYLTYAPQSFLDLQAFFKIIPQLYKIDFQNINTLLAELPDSIKAFLPEIDFEKKIKEIRSNTRTFPSFKNRFFRWFNAFILMKYVHFARDHFYPNIPVTKATQWLLTELKICFENLPSKKEMLSCIRDIDRNTKHYF